MADRKPLSPEWQAAADWLAARAEEPAQDRAAAAFRAGMKHADLADELPPYRNAGEAANAIRAAMPATSVRLLDAEAVRAAIAKLRPTCNCTRRSECPSVDIHETLDEVLRRLGLAGERAP